jgi:hypothetical protein
MPFSVTAFKASMFFGSLLKDREKRLKSSILKRFSNSLPLNVYFHSWLKYVARGGRYQAQLAENTIQGAKRIITPYE